MNPTPDHPDLCTDAATSASPDHLDRSGRRSNLGVALSERFERTATPQSLAGYSAEPSLDSHQAPLPLGLLHRSPTPYELAADKSSSTTFIDNMRLPVHRWFRYSAGFSATWAESLIHDRASRLSNLTVLDPFVGSGTTLLAAQRARVPSYGIEAHPFVTRIARAKLLWGSDPNPFVQHADAVALRAEQERSDISHYPSIIRASFGDESLDRLDRLRRAQLALHDGSPAAELTWLALVAILRSVSHVGTAQWQYVLPNKRKTKVAEATAAFAAHVALMAADMQLTTAYRPPATLVESDARTCEGIPDQTANLVVTSPPYANNYDYADATRLEMSFLGQIRGYSDLHSVVRQYLVRSCSHHLTEKTVDISEVLEHPMLLPIRSEIQDVCEMLGAIRLTRGGRKNYHLMVATYFLDMAHAWQALRRVCTDTAEVCFVLGDSAPYGIYVPVIEWHGRLAVEAGFSSYTFEKTRDRNIKWKNRKHRVPLVEGRLWVRG